VSVVEFPSRPTATVAPDRYLNRAKLAEDGHTAIVAKDGGGNRYALPDPPKVKTCECRSQLVEADGQDRHCLSCGRRRPS
jgi:hypothetical protein